ncbi:hypothetical protein ABZY90_24210, partial [Streptomyces sp. NPDC006422]
MPGYVAAGGGSDVGAPLVSGVEGSSPPPSAGAPEGAGATADLDASGAAEEPGERDAFPPGEADAEADRVTSARADVAGPAAL